VKLERKTGQMAEIYVQSIHLQELSPLAREHTCIRCSRTNISHVKFEGGNPLVEPEALTLLARTAIRNCSFMLLRHLARWRRFWTIRRRVITTSMWAHAAPPMRGGSLGVAAILPGHGTVGRRKKGQDRTGGAMPGRSPGHLQAYTGKICAIAEVPLDITRSEFRTTFPRR